jgi:arabinofuranosyltransferase
MSSPAAVPRRGGALAALAILGLFLAHAAYLACVAEDAFISFRFARNWAQGHGLVWNPGDAPVEGYTNFLWVVLSAGWLRLGVDPGLGAQILGLAASVAALACVQRSARVLLGFGPVAALLPCIYLALAGPFAAWAAGGLETNLFAAWLALALHAFGRYAQGGAGPRALWLCFGALLLATLTRPEGALAWAVLLCVAAAASAGRARAALRELAAPLGATLGLFALYFAWRWSYFGYPLPNTYYAKTGGGLVQAGRGLRYAIFFLRDFGLPFSLLLALALLPRSGARAGSRAAGGTLERLGTRLREHALLAACAALVLAWSAYVVWVGGDYMAMYRFFVPVLPALSLLLAAATRRAFAAPLLPGPRCALAGAGLALACLGTAVQSTPLETLLYGQPPQMHGNWRGVQTERWHVARLSAIGRFFAAHAHGPEESLVTDAIGAISWYSGLRVHGMHGLVDPVLSHRPAPGLGSGWPGHERVDLAYLFSLRPSYFMFGRKLVPERPRRAALPAFLDRELVREYRLASGWVEDPGNGEAGWLVFLERRDLPAGATRESGAGRLRSVTRAVYRLRIGPDDERGVRRARPTVEAERSSRLGSPGSAPASRGAADVAGRRLPRSA